VVAHRTTIRPAPWLYVVLAIGELIATVGAVVIFLQYGWSWLTIALAATALFFSLGFVDLAISRIELTPDAVEIVELLGRRTVARRDITLVKSEGGKVLLRLQDGRWFELPDTGLNSLGIANTVRAWLNAN
jgi:hypothetical protein